MQRQPEPEAPNMPNNLEMILHRLNDVIALVQSGGYRTAALLLQMASLELRLKAASITDEEFRALVEQIETQADSPPQNGPKGRKLSKIASS